VAEREDLARRRELVCMSAALQRTRAGVRLDRLQRRESPVLAVMIDLGRRLFTPQLALTVATILARRLFASRAR
jgi:hypothetical protein